MNEITEKVVCPHKDFDINTAHKIMAQIEHKQGWSSTDNALFTVLENGELAIGEGEYVAIRLLKGVLDGI